MLSEIVVGVVVIVVIGVALWSWWCLPKRETSRLTLSNDKERADVEDNFRKTLGQFMGGTAVLIGAASAYYQTRWTLQATHEQLISQQEQTRLTLQATHEQLISQQVSKGFELLGQHGSDKIVVRLGGIYALEGVMKTSEQYHQPVLEALCAFVRDGANTDTPEPPADIQATLTVIGRREGGTGDVDLSGAHMPNVRLFGADLSGANLRHADLRNADLRRAKLSGANLDGARLNDADLSGASLISAKLIGTDLRGAHLLQGDFSGADLINADLRSADLSNAIVTQSQLNKACVDKGTKLPSGLDLKPCYR